MRTLIFLILALATLPASAANWSRYENSRFGYGVDVPPDYAALGESDNGDGQVFKARNGRETLTAWGSYLVDTDFSGEIAQRISDGAAAGWDITYQSITPTWASWSGSRAGSVVYARAIASCRGQQAAFFTLEYSKADIARLDVTVNRLVRSLKGPPAC